MKKAIPLVGLLFAIWVGYDQYSSNNAQEIKDRERRSNEIEKEQTRMAEELERDYNLKVAELEKKFAANEIKDVVEDTKDIYLEKLNDQRGELEIIKAQNADLTSELQLKTDSIQNLILANEELVKKIQEKDNIIALKDSLISVYNSEILSLRRKSREIVDVLKQAIQFEMDGDNNSRIFNRKLKIENYISARKLYKKLWKEYEIVSAEDSFHTTWEKLNQLGVELDE